MQAAFSYRVIFVLLLSLIACLSMAAVDIHKFDTDSQRIRYQQLSEELRCPKCQNQNLAGSDSQIAGDLRRELHRLLLEGKTDKEIKGYLVARYGDFVLYKPRFQSNTLVLWMLPIGLLFGGVIVLFFVVQRRKDAQALQEGGNLSDTEAEELNQLLEADKSQEKGDKAE